MFAYLIAKIGKADVTKLTQVDIYEAMEANRHRIQFANYIATAVSMLSKEAVKSGGGSTTPLSVFRPRQCPS